MPNSYDHARRRRATRRQRERGVSVYIPAEELEKAGIGSDGAAPFYRVWGSARGSVTLILGDLRDQRPRGGGNAGPAATPPERAMLTRVGRRDLLAEDPAAA